MSLEQILEALMLVCFGAAWPLSIYKSWTSRSSKGKSLQFLCVILVGYAAGVVKCLVSANGISYPLLTVYLINAVMVCVDTALYFRNSALEKRIMVSHRNSI